MGQQFLMGADFTDLSMVQHDDTIRVLHGRESVRNHDRRLMLHQLHHRILNERFSFGVDA